MVRVGAINCLYSDSYFNDLRAILGSSLHLCCVLSREGRLVEGGIFVETAGLVHYHLSATATECKHFGPNKLIITFVRTWAQEQLNKVFHLGGGVGSAEDSLFHFKAGFSPALGHFDTYHIVVDESKNATLRHAAKSVRRISGLESSNFFPEYSLL